MLRTIEATIDSQGHVSLAENVKLSSPKRAIVNILEDEPVFTVYETALLSETALAEDWNRPEEDEAWYHLQPEGEEDVALIAADELTGLLETAHLLRSPANAERLLTTLAQVRQGDGAARTNEAH